MNWLWTALGILMVGVLGISVAVIMGLRWIDGLSLLENNQRKSSRVPRR